MIKLTKRLLIILFLFVFPVSAQASNPVPDDFAFGILLTPQSQSGVYRFTMPEIVYMHVKRSDLGDIRIFNKNSELVPFSMKTQVPAIPLKPTSTELAFFPVRVLEADKKSGRFSVKIDTDPNGAIINVSPQNALPYEGSENQQFELYYLIDLTSLKTRPDQLKFEWHQASENMTISTRIEYSDDLSTWKPFIRDTSLVKLAFAGHNLIRDRVDMPGKKAKYLKMSWPVSHKSARLEKISALFTPEVKKSKLLWKTLKPVNSDFENKTFDYLIPGHFPIQKLNIHLGTASTALRTTLYSRKHPLKEWDFRASLLFYQVTVNGITLKNNPAVIGYRPDRLWQLKADPESSISANTLPGLSFGWRPHDVYFLSQGPGPYTLAFGSWEILQPDDVVKSVFRLLENQKPESNAVSVSLGEIFTLGIDKPEPGTEKWNMIAVWAVLIAGVLILGGIAFRLIRQINA